MKDLKEDFKGSSRVLLGDLARVGPWLLLAAAVILVGVMITSAVKHASKPKESPVILVKIIKVENAIPGTQLGSRTLVELPDGTRRILKGDYGKDGESINLDRRIVSK